MQVLTWKRSYTEIFTLKDTETFPIRHIKDEDPYSYGSFL